MTDSYIPKKVNPISLAQNAKSIVGKVDIAQLMPRLDSILVKSGDRNINAIANFELNFGVDASGKCFIDGKVTAKLELICQRCLSSMELDINSNFKLSPVAANVDLRDLPDEYEPLVLDGDVFSPAQMLEDELLLCIPYAPMHEENCAKNTVSHSEVVKDEIKPNNPFNVLKDL